jgi:hypothetical protein
MRREHEFFRLTTVYGRERLPVFHSSKIAFKAQNEAILVPLHVYETNI